MLTPKQLETAGDEVAEIYTQMEADVMMHVAKKLLSMDSSDLSFANIGRLSQSDAIEIRGIINSYRQKIRKAVERSVRTSLEKSDNDDMKIIEEGQSGE